MAVLFYWGSEGLVLRAIETGVLVCYGIGSLGCWWNGNEGISLSGTSSTSLLVGVARVC